jgi:hypothetical protein
MIAPPAPKLPAGAKVSSLSGGPPKPAAKPAAKPAVKPVVKNSTPKSAGRPTGKKAGPAKTIKGYSRQNIQQVVGKVEELRSCIVEEVKEKYQTQELNDTQVSIVDQLCESIVCATEIVNWQDKVKECVNDLNTIEELHTLHDILEISGEHELQTYPSAILYHSEKI